MTREEERKIAAKERADWHQTKEEALNNCKSQLYLYDRIYNSEIASFEAGAIWSDNHPKSPWISVKDDLPCNHEELIVKDSKGRSETKKVIIRYLRKGPSGKMVPKIMDCMMSTFAAGEGSDKFVWHFFCKEYIITHWMPIPELGIKEE